MNSKDNVTQKSHVIQTYLNSTHTSSDPVTDQVKVKITDISEPVRAPKRLCAFRLDWVSDWNFIITLPDQKNFRQTLD